MVPGSQYSTPSLVLRAFPPPDYLTMPAVGLDISDYAIKHLFIKRRGAHFHLESVGKLDLPIGVIELGEIKDPETLLKLLRRVREEYGYTNAHLSLPEAHAYLFQLELPYDVETNVDQLVEFSLKENVPINVEDATFDYSVLEEREHSRLVNVSVYPSAIAQSYADIVEEAGFHVLSAEIEGQATARALLSPHDTEPTIIVDIGRSQAGFSISVGGEVTFTANLEVGGDQFTRAIARGLDVSFQEADKLKRDHGFRDLSESAKVYNLLRPIVEDLRDAIHRHFLYWQMHAGVGKAEDVTRVILVGGNANMPGLPEYLSATLEVGVQVGNVWTNVFSFKEYLPEMHRTESLEYATAAGLAMRSLLRTSV
jgi:type IV pilus assembly protein PilM